MRLTFYSFDGILFINQLFGAYQLIRKMEKLNVYIVVNYTRMSKTMKPLGWQLKNSSQLAGVPNRNYRKSQSLLEYALYPEKCSEKLTPNNIF